MLLAHVSISSDTGREQRTQASQRLCDRPLIRPLPLPRTGQGTHCPAGTSRRTACAVLRFGPFRP